MISRQFGLAGSSSLAVSDLPVAYGRPLKWGECPFLPELATLVTRVECVGGGGRLVVGRSW